MKFSSLLGLTATIFLLSTSCNNSDIPQVSLGLEDSYVIYRMQKLHLAPTFTGDNYKWKVDGEEVGTSPYHIFIFPDEGVHDVSFEIQSSGEGSLVHEFTIKVLHEDVEYSPYISKVHEYRPAPGQFINEIPLYTPGDTEKDIIEKVQQSLSGTNDGLVSLGGFGGYVTFSFDHTCINIPGVKDFRIWGNAFYEATGAMAQGGSAEPGIVMVSLDINGNGIPDDTWYELAGSEYSNPLTLHNYSITYTPSPEGATWKDNQGKEGLIKRISSHNHSYFPLWRDDTSYTMTGTRLPDNATDPTGKGNYFVLSAYPWGYVDNHPNELADLNSFDISWAVDENGTPVSLPGVDFIRVYTGVNQYCGWIGETSTELSRAQDLHI